MIKTIRTDFSHTDLNFYKQLTRLALPISAQMMLTTLLGFIDIVMLSQVSTTAMATVGAANKLFFLFIMVTSGLTSAAGILVAQYKGKGDNSGIRTITLLLIALAFCLSLPVALITALKPQWIMHLFSSDPELIATGSGYLQTTAIYHILTAAVMSYATLMRSTGNTLLPMMAGFIAVAINTGLNYLLIFGHFGFAEMGVKGAAIATDISRAIELAILLTACYWTRHVSAISFLKWRSLFDISVLKKLCANAWPITINEFIWALAIFTFSAIYGHISTDALAVITMLTPIESISLELFVGFSSASAIMLGQKLGADKFDTAYHYANVFRLIIPGAAVIFGLLIGFNYQLLLSFYPEIDATNYAIAKQGIWIIAATLWLRMYNVVACVGILRSGGDTRFTLRLDLITLWLFVIPVSATAAFYFHAPVIWVYAIALGSEAVIKAPFYWRRIIKRYWLTNLTVKTSHC